VLVRAGFRTSAKLLWLGAGTAERLCTEEEKKASNAFGDGADFGGLRPDLKLAQLNEEAGLKKCPFQCNTPREGSIGACPDSLKL